uniref:Uncharacterized protein n=1 Tax=Arundo donax TaxID=35708 RepID=A0A0A9AIW4_ARUDO
MHACKHLIVVHTAVEYREIIRGICVFWLPP